MIEVEDLVAIIKITELLQYGVDISSIESWKVYYNPESKKIQTRISEKIPNLFAVKFDDECLKFFDWPIMGEYVYRTGTKIRTINNANVEDSIKEKAIPMNLATLKQIMTAMKERNIAQFAGFKRQDYDEDYAKNYEKIIASWDSTDVSEASMVESLSITNTRRYFNLLMTLAQYPEATANRILKRYDTPSTSFGIKGLEAHKIIDNRLYIRLSPDVLDEIRAKFTDHSIVDSMKYLVISRNPYDMFFCSYGSYAQSCFSLNSSNHGWYGMLPYCTTDAQFIVYCTTGVPNQINLIKGEKTVCPKMIWRAWAWLGEDGKLLLDKIYYGSDLSPVLPTDDLTVRARFVSIFTEKYLGYKAEKEMLSSRQRLLKDTAGLLLAMSENLKTYRDSTSRDSEHGLVYRGWNNGERCFTGTCHYKVRERGMFYWLDQITKLDKDFTYSADFVIVGGHIMSKRRCPTTGLFIAGADTHHPLAKYFTQPSNHTLVMTYCDGRYWCDTAYPMLTTSGSIQIDIEDTSNGNYCNIDGSNMYLYYRPSRWDRLVNIKTFKEQVTGLAKRSIFNNVLVRYIEDDKVTFVKYKGAKNGTTD